MTQNCDRCGGTVSEGELSYDETTEEAVCGRCGEIVTVLEEFGPVTVDADSGIVLHGPTGELAVSVDGYWATHWSDGHDVSTGVADSVEELQRVARIFARVGTDETTEETTDETTDEPTDEPTDEYSKSRYSDELAEAANVVAGHGFEMDAFGGMDEGEWWYGLAEVSPVLLRNLGEDDLADRLEARAGITPSIVLWTEDDQGFVTTEMAGFVGTSRERMVIELFEKMEQAYYREDYAD